MFHIFDKGFLFEILAIRRFRNIIVFVFHVFSTRVVYFGLWPEDFLIILDFSDKILLVSFILGITYVRHFLYLLCATIIFTALLYKISLSFYQFEQYFPPFTFHTSFVRINATTPPYFKTCLNDYRIKLTLNQIRPSPLQTVHTVSKTLHTSLKKPGGSNFYYIINFKF